jgi:hypothetical protein
MQHPKLSIMLDMLIIIVDYDAHIIPQYACVIDKIKLNYNGTLFLVNKADVLQGGGLCKQVLFAIADNDEKTKSEKYPNNLIWIMPAKGLKSKRGLRYIRSLFFDAISAYLLLIICWFVYC